MYVMSNKSVPSTVLFDDKHLKRLIFTSQYLNCLN